VSKYRDRLPQLNGGLFLTDGGLETTLIFHQGVDLPYFAAFHLMRTPDGRERLRDYYRTYAALASQMGTGMVFESVTWRANADWGGKLGYAPNQLAQANRDCIHLIEELRAEYEERGAPAVVSACLGPRGDGYEPSSIMTAQEAEQYHAQQIDTLAVTTADMICALTLNYTDEAIGIVRAASRAAMPVAISFTVETDGRLPTGESLGSAIERVDNETSGYSSYFMINCAHPEHFSEALASNGDWRLRIRGVRANASRKSHAELNDSTELDMGDPQELGSSYVELKRRLPNLTVAGGCCGTDHRHVEEIGRACAPLFRSGQNGNSQPRG
jgi:S-methylmethionine-dependent homocysteine/selenocysteine methylase